MGDNDTKKRGQFGSYTKRSVDPIVSRTAKPVRSATTNPYRAASSKKIQATTADVIAVPKQPIATPQSEVKAPLAVTSQSVQSQQKPAQPIIKKEVTKKTTQRQVSQKVSLLKRPLHRRTMKHIPTLPAPSRKGLLGLYDKLVKIVVKQKKVLYAFGCIAIIAVAGWYGYGWYETKNNVKKEAAYIRAVTAATDPDAAAAYIESQPTIGSIDLYTVDATAPRVLTVPKLGLLTSIKKVGTGGTNQIANPQNIFEAGWYEVSATPGSPGAVALIANVSGPTKESGFRFLNKLTIGDAFTIERGDKTLVRYVVVATENIAYGRPVIEKLMKSYDPAKEGANIITGVGAFNRANKDYLNRLIIYAVRENAPQETQVPTTSR